MTPMEKDIAMAQKIAALVQQQGGRVCYVGGFVRDTLLHRENKDIDIEVHGISPAALEAILDSLGQRLAMGESFGIYGLRGCSLDIAMPRKSGCRGSGHDNFGSFVEPFAGTEEAARRRDFTINALMQDVLTGQILDYFGGREDLAAGVIRHVSGETFSEDPLRALRAAQFAARFGFRVAPETIALCRKLSLKDIARERVFLEVQKALLKAERPSVFFETLRQMEQLEDWFPEVKALIGVGQSPRHHAEGDVWNHTMMVLDEAARLRAQVANPLGFMLSALTHDFGKAVCSEEVDGVIHAYGHEKEGLPLVKQFLKRITCETRLLEYVLNLTELHMKPNVVAGVRSAVKVTNKMFDAAVDPVGLICIALADDRGRITREPGISHEDFLRQRLEIYREYMSRPYVAGKDLVAAGMTPGVHFTKILEYAHKLRLAGVPKEEALRHVLGYARSLEKEEL